MLRFASRGLVLLVVVAAACSARLPPYDPFKVPRDEILGRINTVALTPVGSPQGIDDPEAVRAAFRTLIENRMQAGGFKTISDLEYDGRWKKAAEEAGGLYDAVSGQYDTEKARMIHVALGRKSRASVSPRLRHCHLCITSRTWTKPYGTSTPRRIDS